MAADENARVLGGRKEAAWIEPRPVEARSVDDAVDLHAAKPSFDCLADYRRVRLDLIPLHRRGKAPVDRGWQERHYDQEETLGRVRRDGLNLGVRLPADVVVVDVDPRNFVDGRDSLAELAAAVGLDLSSAPHVLTGNLEHPGHHYYFRKPAAANLLDSVDGFEGIEFKSLGRQVVAAGSVHPTGGTYRWAPDSTALPDMPQLPALLVDLARRPRRKESAGAGEITVEQLAASLENLDPTDFQDHDRWLGLMMACHHATDGEGRREFIEWSVGDPQFADHEWPIGRRWDSLHTDRDGAVTIATLRRHLIEAGADIAPPNAEDDFEVWENDGEQYVSSRRWRFLSIDEVEALPPPRWLVQGVLTEASLVAIYGAPESGKSFLAVDMAMAVAGGMDWHGRSVQRGGVLYIAAEGASGLGKRMRAWKVERCVQGGTFLLHLMRDELNLAADNDGSVRTFVQAVVDELGPLSLIVVDTLNQTAAGADENSAKDMGRYIASMKHLRDATGAAVIVVHHSGKDVSKGMRGSTALLGAMDTTVEVVRSSDGRSIAVAVRKQKDAEREGVMRFNLEKVGDSLVLRATVMAEPVDDFASKEDPVVELACQMADNRNGCLAQKDLVVAICDRDGVADATARRRIKNAIPDARENAVVAADGRHVWQEAVNKSHPKQGIVIRIER